MSRSPNDPQELLGRWAVQGVRLGLERPRAISAALGAPERRFPAVLVAGTNGKGSVAAKLAAMLGAAGYRAGLYTSPELETVEEQVRIDGACIAPAELTRLLLEVEAAARRSLGGPPTPFEALTAAAFLAFAERRVELAVVEVGMGGARDATNLAEPILSIVTSVSLEHRRFLGDTVGEIAREKAGVFRRDKPALTAAAGEALAELEAAAGRVGAELHREPPPGGSYEEANRRLAVRAAGLLAAAGWDRLGAKAIETGAAVRLPGRLEEVELPGGRRVLLDAAHNPAAVAALVRSLHASPGETDLLFGVLTDKEAGEMLPPLAALARRLILTRPPGPRGRDPRELPALLPAGAEAAIEPELSTALDRLLDAAPGGLAVVTGSMVLVGAVRTLLRRRFGVPAQVCRGRTLL